MMQARIHPETTIGAVCLHVSNMARVLDFYLDVLGFQIHRESDSRVNLGAGKEDLIILKPLAGASQYTGKTGLYHLAILLPSRRHLALSLKRIAETRTPVQGYADHLVSEAVYLADPEGNGIELYRDRPRDQWPMRDDQLVMASDPLDVTGIMNELGQAAVPWSGLPSSTRIGHVHLQVSDLSAADSFYSDLLGFDFIMHFGPSAGFVSAGGYHHHIGYNTWATLGAEPPPADTSGLAWFTIDLPSKADLEVLLNRLKDSNQPFELLEEGIYLNDSSGIDLILRVKPDGQ